jgi:hypothetical protein
MALVLLVPVLPDLTAGLGAPKAAKATVQAGAAGGSGAECSVRHIASLLAPYAGQVVLADVNETPELLYRTKVKTVGSLYFNPVPSGFEARSAPGAVRSLLAWSSPGNTQTEPAAVRATGATLVLACPGQLNANAGSEVVPDTLYDRLNRNEPPPWLERLAAGAGHVLYQVRPAQ